MVIAGGGTGGHLYSGLAVYESLMKNDADRHRAFFIGARNGIERDIFPRLGVDHAFIGVGKLRGGTRIARLQAAFVLPLSVLSAVAYLLRFKPDVALGVGGYASGPAIVAALLLRIPTAIIEQNSTPGMTNRILGRWVKKVFLGLPGTEANFPPGKGIFVGNPVRNALFSVPPVDQVGRPFTILVFGGSQGARGINTLVVESLPGLTDHMKYLKFIHVTGPHDSTWVTDAYRRHRMTAEVYTYADDMKPLYARSHFVIARSGALTVSELAATGRPALLIPYPFATDDHQAKNAAYLTDSGAALMMREKEITGHKLSDIIINTSMNQKKLAEMGKRAKALARPDAAEKIVEWLLKEY
jgi:UDP-N-acetylglucosamine--N-acetylmuramyl-(pentapeptide) pyrophosphoryl-undecaprenol N-acetylglucosamine transferase